MILCDKDIRRYCNLGWLSGTTPGKIRIQPLLDPFSEAVQDGVISYGLSQAGYDLRLGDKVLVFKNTNCETVNPKKIKDPKYMERLFDVLTPKPHEEVWLPPHGYVLGYSLEYIRMPRWLKGRCVGKSTLARCGVLVNTTPLEPGWEGHLTIEIANVCPCPVTVFAHEGIAQLEFELLTDQPEVDYGQKGGVYQCQGPEPTVSRTKG